MDVHMIAVAPLGDLADLEDGSGILAIKEGIEIEADDFVLGFGLGGEIFLERMEKIGTEGGCLLFESAGIDRAILVLGKPGRIPVVETLDEGADGVSRGGSGLFLGEEGMRGQDEKTKQSRCEEFHRQEVQDCP